jgi:predicted nucleic acid-binding Zn ribbon protein
LWRDGGVVKGKLTPIQELLPSVLASLANSSGNARHFKPAWDRIVGPIISRHSSPVLLQGDVLTVEVTNPGWARELAGREAEIRGRLAIAFGKKPLSKLVFRSRE